MNKTYSNNQKYNIYVTIRPPYIISISEPKPRGLFIEIVEESLNYSNNKHKFFLKESLNNRSQDEIKTKHNLFYSFRTPERENKYLWVHPLFYDLTCVYNLKYSKEITSLSHLKNLRTIGTVAAGVGESALKSFSLEGQMYYCSDDETCIKRLKNGEIAWITQKSEAKYYRNKYKIEKEFNPYFQISDTQGWLASSLNLPPKNQQELNAAVKKFMATPNYLAIIKKYGVKAFQNDIYH